MKENILSKLLTECPFPEVFEDTEKVEGCSFPGPSAQDRAHSRRLRRLALVQYRVAVP